MQTFKYLIQLLFRLLFKTSPKYRTAIVNFLLKLRPESAFLMNQRHLIFCQNIIKNPNYLSQTDKSLLTEENHYIDRIKFLVDNDLKTLARSIIFSQKPEWFFNNITVQESLLKITKLNFEHEFTLLFNELNQNITKNYKFLVIKNIDSVESSRINLSNERDYFFDEPQTINELTSKPVTRKVTVPSSWVSEVMDATVSCAFQIIKESSMIIYEPAAHPSNGLVAGVWKHFKIITDNLALFSDFPKEESYHKIGILISGRATENYFHWLIEYLPKLYNIAKSGYDCSIPLIVMDNLYSQQYESLECYNIEKRPILKINPYKKNHNFDKLIIPSTSTYHTDNFKIPFWMGSAISHEHLYFLRTKALESVSNNGIIPPTSSKRIFVSRPHASVRNITNNSEVSELLKHYQFEIVSTEKLTFFEQVALFNSVECIVGAAGAAMSNLIFCNNNCKVLCLVNERVKEFCMQSNLANFAGAEFVHVVGKTIIPDKNSSPTEEELVHASFKVNLTDLKDALEKLKIIT